MKNELLNAALNYRQKYDFSVLPAKRDKKALIPWEEFQKRKPDVQEIKEWWRKYPDANPAIVTGAISHNLGVIDQDTEEGRSAIEELLPESFITPMTATPRKGTHLYCLIPEGLELRNNSRMLPGCDFRGEGGYILAPPSITEHGQYKWIPGLSIDEVPMVPLPQAYIDFVTGQASQASSYSLSLMHCIKRGCKENVRNWFTEGRRDNDLFHVANQLIKAGSSVEEVTQVLEILAQNCIPPFPEKEIKTKIESALSRVERRERNLSREVQEWVSLTNGYFFLTDIYESLHILIPEQKNNVYQILHRMQKDGLIDKHGNKNGCYRLIDTFTEEIDFLNASTEYLHIKWPFEIENYVKTLPKNIAIVAGVSNSGKTALLLNLIEMNMNKHDIYYFSSEMGNVELRDRLGKFKRPLDSWKFKAVERSSNFSDVIRKDAINIIDYLEIHDDFYRIGGYIKEIYDKLDKGVAIIAIQKNPGQTLGLGGGRSIEKARLYLSMDAGRLRIEKGKNWANQTNPNGLEINFKLVQGCQFKPQGTWKKS